MQVPEEGQGPELAVMPSRTAATEQSLLVGRWLWAHRETAPRCAACGIGSADIAQS